MTATLANNRYVIFVVISVMLILMVRELFHSQPELVYDVHKSIGNAFKSNGSHNTQSSQSGYSSKGPAKLPSELIPIEAQQHLKYHSTSPDSFDLVMNLYKENTTELAVQVDELRALPLLASYSEIRVFIYVKDEEANLDALKKTFNTPYVVHRPNKGRESSSFLTHIIEHWDDLGAHTFFRQAVMHHHDQAMAKLHHYLLPPSADDGPHTGMLSLGWIDNCLCTHCHDGFDGSRIWARIPQLYSAIHGAFCPEEIVITYLGQFVVSRKRIRDNSKFIYSQIKELLVSEMEHWIHKDPNPGGLGDSPNGPYFGHTVERLWMVLFGCESTELTKRCGAGLGTIYDAPSTDDPIDKCQCMDT